MPRPPYTSLRCALAAAIVVSLLVLAATPLRAMHRQTAFLVNLSKLPGGNSSHAAPPQFEPNHVYFQSVSDLKHNGSTGSEIFLYVLRPDLPDSNTLRQITNFAGDSQDASASETGWVAAFDSNADIIGNGNVFKQIFLFYRAYNSLVQLTDGLADSTLPAIDLAADAVAFQSMADLKGSGGLTGFSQIWVYSLIGGPPPCDVSGCHLDPNKLFQVTNWAGNSTNPYLDPSGRYVFFQSDVFGSSQIFVFDRGNGGLITQVTTGAGDSVAPTADQTGNFVAFQSNGDLLGLGTTGWQIYYLDRERNDLRQITKGAGDSTKPSLGNSAQTLSFVSHADLLGTGAIGQHLFGFDPHTLHLFQVTKDPGTVSDNPRTAGNFILFDTDEDIMRTGMTGRQVYSVDLFNHVPPLAIGKRVVPLQPRGQLTIKFGDRDPRSEGPLQVLIASGGSTFPPVPVPDVGTFCLTATGNGQGFHDCRGGRPGGDILVTQDHDTSDFDFTCVLQGSCREGNACKLPLLSPHRKPCPACVNGTCSDGPNAGAACFENSTCLLNQTCVDGGLGVCNGPVRVQHAGAFSAGGVQFSMPVTVGLSMDAGRNGIWCDADDTWIFQNYPTRVDLTTGSVTGVIDDANDVPDSGLVAMDTGTAFDCFRLERGNYQGTSANGAFVGVLPLLDVPTLSGVKDVIVPLRFTAFAGTPYVPCTGLSCRIITYCNSNADCDDNSVCNGQEQCINNSCVPGISLNCDDGNPCNGTEACDPTFGCQPGNTNPCDDGARCTADTCDITTGACSHTSIPGCCTSDLDCRDNNVCNGAEHCVAGNCVAGTPLVCDDGNACNGVETCDPTVGCVPGTAPNCNDGARCTVDTCDPALGCVHTSVHGCCATDADCRDNNVCNGQEGCFAGDCVPGTPLQCDDGNVCNGIETCDPYSGCVEGTALVCPDDGARCTADTCDPVNGCIHTSISGCCTSDADCINNNACDGQETCVAGDCFGGVPLLCNDGNVCNGVETCVPSIGCVAGTPLACGDDGARCTADLCDATLGCIHPSISGCCVTDADCQDTSACNGLERCVAGDCVAGTPLFCDDGDKCNGKETCVDTLGCIAGIAPPSFTFDGVQCILDTLWNAFRNANPGSLGGRGRYGSFQQILVAVRKHFGYVSPHGDGTVTKSVIKPLFGVRMLRLFERRMNSGLRHGVIVPAAGQPLNDMADAAITALLEFNAQGPRPNP